MQTEVKEAGHAAPCDKADDEDMLSDEALDRGSRWIKFSCSLCWSPGPSKGGK